MLAQRLRVPNGLGTAKALDYSLKRWVALPRHRDDGAAPIDNNYIEQQIRPVAFVATTGHLRASSAPDVGRQPS